VGYDDRSKQRISNCIKFGLKVIAQIFVRLGLVWLGFFWFSSWFGGLVSTVSSFFFTLDDEDDGIARVQAK
jgi:hypothetical protein